MDTGKKVLETLRKYTNIVNVDITELNMDLGSKVDVKKSGKNTVELFKYYLN